MIDSHCHLGIDDFKENTENLLENAKRAGVSHILTVACDYVHIDDLLEMMKYQNVLGAFGIHPENVAHFDADKVYTLFKNYPQITALGEIGLDYYYNLDTKEIQKEAFEKQIEIASLVKKPIIIHSRDANEDTSSILKKAFKNNMLNSRGVLHCFTGSYELAKEAIDMGLYISASGVITFKNANNLREIFKKIPLESILIETDSPYLAPNPFRGKRNEPAYVVETLKALSILKGVDLEIAEETTSKNFFNLFQGQQNEG